MKKVWVPREALIPKPFYKQKIFVFFCLLLCVSITFLIYQVKFVSQLQNPTELFAENLSSSSRGEPRPSAQRQQQHHAAPSPPAGVKEINTKSTGVLRGIRIRDIDSYTQKLTSPQFQCLDRSKRIDWTKVNDDFCDCYDGTDETYTNACANGRFYCSKQHRHITGRGKDVFVPTSRINDGICDCKLDCSDEFQI